MARLFLFIVTLQFTAILLVFPNNAADAAKYCGCTINYNSRWSCFRTTCDISCRDVGRWFPDKESCLRRSVVPARSAKSETESPSKKKVVQAPPPKKPAVKLAQKPAPSKLNPPKPISNSPKPASNKKQLARLEPEQQQTPAPAPEMPVVKQDRDADPPIATANLSPETASPSANLPKAPLPLGRRIALVIGNSAYASVPALKNPAPDARAIADTLANLGFERVTLKLDLDRQATGMALAKFADDASRADWAVVYYAGHGIEVDGQNYLIPIDATLDSDRKVLFETVPLDHVVEATAGARKFRLVILDACRNNPFLSSMTRAVSSRSIGRGLSRIEPQGGVLVAYAAKAGEIALDGDAGNSPFVTALIEQLKQPGVEVGFLFRRVRDSVLDMTNGTQEPYTYGSLPGREELYFKPPVN